MGYSQGWDQIPTFGPETEKQAFSASDYTIVYPVSLRKNLNDSEVKYDDSLMYIASTVEKAKEWCMRNLDIEAKDDPSHWWWFAISQEAIDGDYSGIKGLICLLDWNGADIPLQPLEGYKEKKAKEKKMATKLTKQVTRETEAKFVDRPLMVELDPNNGEAVVTLWPKGTQQKHSVDLAFLYSVLHSGDLSKVQKELEKKAAETNQEPVPDIDLELEQGRNPDGSPVDG